MTVASCVGLRLITTALVLLYVVPFSFSVRRRRQFRGDRISVQRSDAMIHFDLSQRYFWWSLFLSKLNSNGFSKAVTSALTMTHHGAVINRPSSELILIIFN